MRYHVAMHAYDYAVELVWEGNLGRGTADYASYSRQFRATARGKPAVIGSADHGPAPAPAKPRADLAVRLANRPGALAELGERMGAAGVSFEGGGGFVVDDGVGGTCVVHFLVRDAETAARALADAGITVLGIREVIELRLDQDRPGQMGLVSRALADAGVNIECVYSDHDHRLVLVVDDPPAARGAIAAWR